MESRSFIRAAFILLFFELVVVSCSERNELSVAELKRYPVDPTNGLIQTAGDNNFNFEVIYRPKDLIIEQNVGDHQGAKWDSMAAQLRTYDYFIIRISKNKKEVETFFAGDPASYMKVMNYLNGVIANDIFMIVDNETVRVSDALFAPAYGMSEASSVLITFNSNLAGRKADFKIVFVDGQFGTGRHEFSFEFASIEAIPKLAKRI